MDNPYPYLLPYWVSLQVVLIILVVLWQRKAVLGATSFLWVMGMEAFWTLGFIFETASVTLGEKLFWDNMQFLPYLATPLLFLKFAYRYLQRKLSPRLEGILWAITVVGSLLPWLDPWTGGLVRASASLHTHAPFAVLTYPYSPYMYLTVAYNYLVLIGTLGLLIQHLIKTPGSKRSLGSVIVGILLPVLGGILTLTDVEILYQRDLTPVTFALGGAFIVWGLFRGSLFTILPVANEVLFNNLRDPAIVLDTQGLVLEYNLAFREFPGLEGASLEKGLSIAPYLPRWDTWIAQALTPVEVQGRWYDLSVQKIKSTGGAEGYLLTFHEITQLAKEKSALEASLTQSREQMDLALTLSGASLFENDFSSGTAVSTPGLYQMLGYTLESIPQLIQDLPVHPDDLPGVYQALDRHTRGEAPFYQAEFRMKDAAGAWHWISGKGRVVERFEDGRAKKLIGLSISIQEAKTARLELERKNQELEQFAYTVSHDLKSPLITITSYLGSIEADLERGRADRITTDLHRILHATAKMNTLLTGILDLSRVGTSESPMEEVPLEDILQEVSALLKGTLGDIEIQKTTPLPTLRAHRVRLRQMIQNLIENSIKFKKKEQPLELKISWDGAKRRLLLDDNGIGIDPVHRKKVFGLFEKIESSSSGSGIGLALVKKIAELYGGTVTIDDSPLGGCRLIVTFSTEAVVKTPRDSARPG